MFKKDCLLDNLKEVYLRLQYEKLKGLSIFVGESPTS